MRNVSAVAGLAVDTIHDVVYWVHSPSGLLYESDLNGLSYRRHPRPVLADLQPDRHNLTNHIVLDPYREYLFVISEVNGQHSSVSRYHLPDLEVPKTSAGFGSITSIAINVPIETIYYAKLINDSAGGTEEVFIETCNYEFEQVTTYRFFEHMDMIVSLAVEWNVVFFVEYRVTGEFVIYYTDLADANIFPMLLVNTKEAYFIKLSSRYLELAATDFKCQLRNCSHICLDNITCACPENYQLSADNINCVGIEDLAKRSQTPKVTQTPLDKQITGHVKSSQTPAPAAADDKQPKHKYGYNAVVIVVVLVLTVVVGVTVYRYNQPGGGSFEPRTEQVELH